MVVLVAVRDGVCMSLKDWLSISVAAASVIVPAVVALVLHWRGSREDRMD